MTYLNKPVYSQDQKDQEYMLSYQNTVNCLDVVIVFDVVFENVSISTSLCFRLGLP